MALHHGFYFKTLLEFLSWLPSVIECEPEVQASKFFPPRSCFGHGVYWNSKRNQNIIRWKKKLLFTLKFIDSCSEGNKRASTLPQTRVAPALDHGSHLVPTTCSILKVVAWALKVRAKENHQSVCIYSVWSRGHQAGSLQQSGETLLLFQRLSDGVCACRANVYRS